MKRKHILKLIIQLILLIPITQGQVRAQGILFSQNLDEALIKAKQENKLIFIDFYTLWCGPCKVLSKNVFPLKIVGDFFNSNFINCKIQCDDNGIGVEIGKKYQVGAYPTLMFLNKNGEIVHSSAGAPSPEGLIELGKEAMDPLRNLYSLIKNWETGDKSYESAQHYFKTLKSAYRSEKANEDFNKYFSSLTIQEKINSKTFELIKLINPGTTSSVFNFIENNIKSFYIYNDSVEVNRYLINGYTNYLYSLILSDRSKDYFNALETFKLKNLPFMDEVVKYMYVFETFLNKSFDIKEYQKRGTTFLNHYGMNYDGYTLRLTSLLGNCTGKYNEGTEGIKWMEELISRNNNPRYLSTYLYIVWRNHRWDDAIKIGNKIREKNIKDNKDNTEIDKQIEEFYQYKIKYAERDSIIFENKNFEKVLVKANETGKNIFMDAYTTWCGPCKFMEKNVFTDDKVALFVNRNFVNTKVDMEKGEGITLRERYNIVAYPTFLILDKDGNELHRIVGAFDSKEFIEKIKEGLGDSSISNLTRIYKENRNNNDFIVEYIKKLIECYKYAEAEDVTKIHLSKLTTLEKADPKFWFIYENRRLTSYGGDRYRFIVQNRKLFHERVGEDKVEKLIYSFLISSFSDYLTGRTPYDENRINQIEKEIIILNPINIQDLKLLINLTRMRGEKNFNKFINLVDTNAKNVNSNTFNLIVRVMGFIAEEGGSKEQCIKAAEVLLKFYYKSEDDKNKEYHQRVINYLNRGPYKQTKRNND